MKKKQLLLLSFVCIYSVTFITAQVPQLWGMTSIGGAYNKGTIFKVNGDGTGDTIVFSFVNVLGTFPKGRLLQATNGKLYGTTLSGGSSDYGVLFSFNPANNVFTKLVDFVETNGRNPSGSLMQASDGKLYGTTGYGGVNGMGILFSFDPANNSLTKLHDFDAIGGSVPTGNLIEASDGKLYGMTNLGATRGVIFSYDIAANNFAALYTFVNATGYNTTGSLLQYDDGAFYGLSALGGSSNIGTIFRFDANTNSCSAVHNFVYLNGYSPYGSLMRADNGKLYGLNTLGGVGGKGTLFSFNPVDSSFVKLKNCDSVNTKNPYGTLMQASDGQLYGTTLRGGSHNAGVIFRYNILDGSYTNILNFDTTTSGAEPYGDLIELHALSTNVAENSNDLNITIYPNPTDNYLNFNLSSLQLQQVRIYSIEGKLVVEIKQPTGNRIDISNLAKGIYIAEVALGRKIVRLQWVKM